MYVEVLYACPLNAPTDSTHFRVLVTFMTPLYMHHCRKWSFCRPFILAGGLKSLVAQMPQENLHMRGQVVEVLVRMTDEDMHEWHDKPQDAGDLALMHCMLDLTSTPLFQHIESNYRASYPGGSLMCIQLFAFLCSFIRRHYCKDNVLRLSPNLLSLLLSWSTKGDAEDAERNFAKQLYEDFSRFEPAVKAEIPAPPAAQSAASTSGRAEAEGSLRTEDEGWRVSTDRTVINSGEAVTPVEAWKRKGNALFAKGSDTEAIECYSCALDEPVPIEHLHTASADREALHCNRAACYLRRGMKLRDGGGSGRRMPDKGGELAGVDPAEAGKELNLRAALNDCQQALQYNHRNVKALHRQASALQHLGRHEEAKKAALLARESAVGASAKFKPDIDSLLATLGVTQPSPTSVEALRPVAAAAEAKETPKRAVETDRRGEKEVPPSVREHGSQDEDLDELD